MLSLLYTEAEKNEAHWFLMRAYKNETEAEKQLNSQDELKYFIPKHYVIRIYHGKKNKKLVPVIPSLVFVRASHTQIIEFKKKQFNLLQFVMWHSEKDSFYMIIPDKDMEDFIKVATLQDNVEYFSPEEIKLEKGTRVRIHGGNLDGVEGHFIRVQGKRNRRIVIMLEGVMAIAAEVHPELVEVIRDK